MRRLRPGTEVLRGRGRPQPPWPRRQLQWSRWTSASFSPELRYRPSFSRFFVLRPPSPSHQPSQTWPSKWSNSSFHRPPAPPYLSQSEVLFQRIFPAFRDAGAAPPLLEALERRVLSDQVQTLAPEVVQVWGCRCGARTLLPKLAPAMRAGLITTIVDICCGSLILLPTLGRAVYCPSGGSSPLTPY